MPIPPLGSDGLLPEGVHVASLSEVSERFGRFQRTDRRVRLFAALEVFVAEARGSGVVDSIVIDGSFTTAESNPGDVDIIVVLKPGVDSEAGARPDQYNVVSPRSIRRRPHLDAWVAARTERLSELVRSLARVRGQALRRKGMIRVSL